MPNPLGDLQQKLKWMTRGENCSMCNSLRGRVYTYDTWMSSSVWPGFHMNCDCYLKKVDADTTLSDLDFFGTDLHLLADTINPIPFIHWDPNYEPFSWHMTNEIMNAHLAYGSDMRIGDVLKKMNTEFVGFFKRSKIFDNFYRWRVFRTMQHYQKIDGNLSGGGIILPPRKVLSSAFYLSSRSSYYRPNPFPYTFGWLKPASLRPFFPYQSNYTESR